MLVCNKGSCFLKSVDTSQHDGPKDAEYIAAGIIAEIEANGHENIVQVVTDGASVMRAAWEIIQGKYKNIVCSWCGAHVMDLLMEDIGKLEFFGTAVKEAKQVIKFIRNHQHTDKKFKELSHLALLLPADTRFATAFIMIQRLLAVKESVEEVCSGTEFAAWLIGKIYIDTGKEVQKTVRDDVWWGKIAALCEIISPCVSVMRMCDGNTPAAGKVYMAMVQLGIKLDEALVSEDLDEFVPLSIKGTIRTMLSGRWANMHSPVHGAAMCLDPEYHDVDHMVLLMARHTTIWWTWCLRHTEAAINRIWPSLSSLSTRTKKVCLPTLPSGNLRGVCPHGNGGSSGRERHLSW